MPLAISAVTKRESVIAGRLNALGIKKELYRHYLKFPLVVAVSGGVVDDNGKRGGREYYLELLDCKKIVADNGRLLESILAYGKAGNKEKRLK